VNPTPVSLNDLARSVVRVGDGRGFIVAAGDDRYVITAAHVLLNLPPAHLMSDLEERTYLRFLGPREEEGRRITVQSVFADPVSDVAILAAPDSQAQSTEWDLYQQFVADPPPFAVVEPPVAEFSDEPFPAYVLSLAGEWTECRVSRPGWLMIEPEHAIVGGMSGSPVVSATGAAVGVVSTSNFGSVLADVLPGWLLRKLAKKRRAAKRRA
jgi:S1-C subfamily serine protease